MYAIYYHCYRLVVGINQRQIAVCLSIPVPLTWYYLSIDQRMGALASVIEVALVVMVAVLVLVVAVI